MNWPRGLFRVWTIASVLWVVGYAMYFWHSCSFNDQMGEYWCWTGESDWIGSLRYFGWKEYLYNAAWIVGVPIMTLFLGWVAYASVNWIVLGFRGKRSN
jgi:hypothetical protein